MQYDIFLIHLINISSLWKAGGWIIWDKLFLIFIEPLVALEFWGATVCTTNVIKSNTYTSWAETSLTNNIFKLGDRQTNKTILTPQLWNCHIMYRCFFLKFPWFKSHNLSNSLLSVPYRCSQWQQWEAVAEWPAGILQQPREARLQRLGRHQPHLRPDFAADYRCGEWGRENFKWGEIKITLC